MRAKLIRKVIGLPNYVKRALVMSVDVILCILTVWLAYYLRLGEWIPFSGHPTWRPMWAAGISVAVAVPIFITQGLYRSIFRHSGWPELIKIAKCALVYGLIYFGVFTAVSVAGVPRTIGIIQPMLLVIMVGLSRTSAKYWLGGGYQNSFKSVALPRVLIYGAGSAGRQLVLAMSNSREMRVVGFLDDDPRLHGLVLSGQPILDRWSCLV